MVKSNIRVATEADAEALLAIYAPYVEHTAITFEYTVPTVEEFAGRIRQTLKKYPYLVAERNGEILGYAYAGSFHQREAYGWAVETTIYVQSGSKRFGIGRELYEALERALAMQNIINLNACIAYPETEDEYLTRDSVKFHERMGYRLVGEFHKCGYKFHRWYNMVWMEKHLREHDVNPAPVKRFDEIEMWNAGNMKKLLITGGTGFLGIRIAQFYDKKYEIFSPTHSQMDITDEEQVLRVFEAWRPDIVVHCAAVSDVGQCDREPEKSWKINVDGSVTVAKASKRVGAKCILCSSDQVYFGSSSDAAHTEDEELRPHHLYGQGKWKAEQACLAVNPDCVLLRLSWMYDVRTVRNGEHGDFLRTLLLQLQGSETLSYAVYDKRGITDVNEVVVNMEKTFALAGGVYNFGAPNDKNTYETICEVFANAGLDVSRLRRNEDAFRGNPRNLCMSQDKLNQCGIFFSSTAEGFIKNLRNKEVPWQNQDQK